METYERLISKAKEAFVMSIEIYNKPSINYRLEGFSFFICNAWELMLKAHMIKKFGEDSIYYKDKPNRTISLDNCVKKVFTNEKAPLRRNLEKVIDLRNTSTHFITEEYEALYIPLLQACVFNFVDKMKELHDVDMTLVIPENFITLSVRLKSLNETEIRGKYTEQVAEKILGTQRTLEPMIEESNSTFAIKVEHYHYATKNKSEATEFYHIDKDATEGVRIINKLKDPNVTHKYKLKACISEVNKRIEREGIILLFKGEQVTFNKYHFKLMDAYFKIKENKRLCYMYNVSTQPQYSYSQQAVDFIFDEIRKAPSTLLDKLKEGTKKSKSTPGAKEF